MKLGVDVAGGYQLRFPTCLWYLSIWQKHVLCKKLSGWCFFLHMELVFRLVVGQDIDLYISICLCYSHVCVEAGMNPAASSWRVKGEISILRVQSHNYTTLLVAPVHQSHFAHTHKVNYPFTLLAFSNNHQLLKNACSIILNNYSIVHGFSSSVRIHLLVCRM